MMCSLLLPLMILMIDDPVVYAARAVDDAYAAAKLAIDATDAPDLLLALLVATAANAANDRIKAVILLDKANLKRIHAAATHANLVAASANVLNAHNKVVAEAVANLAKELHDAAKGDAKFARNLADACAKHAYNSNVAALFVLRDALARVPNDMDHLTLPVCVARTVLDVHSIRAFLSSAISSE
ncbi:hypothetical protein [Cardinium endosymbiont of Dermatophagoides farinae]|uniref:hypothetical protein n=1 Tax=Cardinium endosymbiont of Dermatophagoides farinae TaxID=2597823 RepID=UPI001183DD84|nr:hypothetical protein [Cardinium endosymbiont of Dermatophagoides farinae]TSJ81465.1 hypothetical protein FPG78_05845 [Cardinium endosymbiont of Dermatophagoides farinae]